MKWKEGWASADLDKPLDVRLFHEAISLLIKLDLDRFQGYATSKLLQLRGSNKKQPSSLSHEFRIEGVGEKNRSCRQEQKTVDSAYT